MKISTCSYRRVLETCNLEMLSFQVDTYVGCAHNCFYCYVLDQAESDWTKEILIHRDIVGQLRSELTDISPQSIYMGYNTDPYQPCEATSHQTRKVLELLLDVTHLVLYSDLSKYRAELIGSIVQAVLILALAVFVALWAGRISAWLERREAPSGIMSES